MFRRYPVQILQFPDIVRRHPAVLPCRGVPVHPALVVPQKPVHVELKEVFLLLVRCQKRPYHRLLPPAHPRIQRVLHKFQGLLLNIIEAALFQVAYHMGRHPEDPRDLINLELPRLQKLCLLRRNGNRRILHPLFQNRHLVCIPTSAKSRLPAFPHPARILDRPRMLQHSRRGSAVRKELTSVFLRGNRQADRILRHRDRRIPYQTVKP